MNKNIRGKTVVFFKFIRCLDGALVSSEINTLNSSGSDPRKNVEMGTTVIFYWSTWKKHEGLMSFFIGRHEINIRGNTVVFIK